jgi:uncharacterized protein YjbI with pentapeptide repeats
MRFFLKLFFLVAILLSSLSSQAVLFNSPALAASSAAIRAFDDVSVQTKDYSGQNLVRAEFSDAKLPNANFSGADLRGAVFNGSVLTGANLHGVDFSDGIAYISNLSQTDLSDAILTSAMMLKSSFRGANVTGADFSEAVLDRDQVLMLCQSASGVNPVTGVDTRESLGCK